MQFQNTSKIENTMIKQPGFTLIELMIAVAIVGILASIAYPSYQESILRSRRADAKAALVGLASAMERHYTANNSYCDAGGDSGENTCGAETNDTGTSSIFTLPPELNNLYTITISAATANSFTVQAAPDGVQSSDKCGTLTLTNTAVKDVSEAESGYTAANCW